MANKGYTTTFKKNFTLISIGISTLFSVFIFIGQVKAQTYDIDYTVDYINDHLDKNVRLFAERKNLRVEFSSGSEVVRIDYLFPESIDYDEGIAYSESEGAVVATCYEKAGKCIERDIVKRDSKILYDRCNFETPCSGDDCQSLEEAIKHLIMLYVLDDHTRTEPF